MRILDDTRSLHDVELHLTDSEAERLVAALAECRDDLANVGMSESHASVYGGDRRVTVYVYTTDEELLAEVADRTSDNS